jgi:L-threonylcarbamoyladenylate synthase
MADNLDTKQALESLNNGDVIIVPTDTIPGLAADATNEEALRKIYEIKNREEAKTLPLLFSSIEQVREFFSLSRDEYKLAETFWPGGLTLVLRPKKKFPRILLSSTGKIGARIPNSRITQELIKEFGKPIAATSINISGEPSITKLEEIPASITAQTAGIFAGKNDYSTQGGKASTVLEMDQGYLNIYREGAIEIGEIKKVLNS